MGINIERARAELNIKKCDMNIAEFSFKILEKKKDIERLEDLKQQQEAQKNKIINELKEKED